MGGDLEDHLESGRDKENKGPLTMVPQLEVPIANSILLLVFITTATVHAC